MNFLNHRQKTRGHVLPMPEGLQELMADISREVLRCQPSIDCIYRFIADYLEAMVNTREKSQMAMTVIEEIILKTDEVFSEFAKWNIPKDKTNSFLDVMELTFRRFVNDKRKRNQDSRFIKFHTDDMLEELMRKCDLTKVEVLRSRPAIQWAYKKFVKTYLAAIEGTLDTEDLYFETEKVLASSKELNQMNQSAIKIQKVFRGYQTRKSLRKSQQQLQFILPSSEDSSSTSSFRDYILARQQDVNKAAIKIQASYKGFCVRKTNVLDTKKKVSLKPHHPVPDGVALSPAEKLSFENSQSIEDSGEHRRISKSDEKTHTSDKEDTPTENLANETSQELPSFQEDSNNNFKEIQDVLEISETNSQDLNEAAVKIQATFKGYRVRKEMAHTAQNENKNTSTANTSNLYAQTSKHSE